MNILVTGGAGFIGSHVVDRYIGLGHDVIIVDNLSTGKKENINPKVTFYEMDIRDKKITDVFQKHDIDIINHHAAQMDVRVSVEDPVLDADINILGLLNLLQNAIKHNVKKIIYVSSGGVVYGSPEKMPPKEGFEFAPESPYGVTKMTGEYYLRYYAKVHGLKFTALRYSNVYGPRQNPHGEAGVVAIFSKRMLNSEECFIFGDGKQTRDYIYVGDVVDANIAALDRGDDESFNIGTSVPTSVNDLFAGIAKIAGYEKQPAYKEARKGEVQENYLDIDKAKEKLSWIPKTKLDEGLKKTYGWIKDEKA